MAKLLTEVVPSKYLINYHLDTTNKELPFRPNRIVSVPEAERIICAEKHYWWRWNQRADQKWNMKGYWCDYDYINPTESVADVPKYLSPENDLVQTYIHFVGSTSYAEIVCNCAIDKIKIYETYEEAYKAFVEEIDAYLAKGGK